MILPVPSGPIELVDLTKYADMFEKLNETRHLTRACPIHTKSKSGRKDESRYERSNPE